MSNVDDLIKLGEELKKHIESEELIQEMKKRGMMKEESKANDFFKKNYQSWYTNSYAVIKQLLPDRLNEFKELYSGDINRKEIDLLTYSIQDWLNGFILPNKNYLAIINSKFSTQMEIFKSVNLKLKFKEFPNIGTLNVLETIFFKFDSVRRQLERRYKNRETLKIDDEYDVQDLLHALLKIHFEDIRPEEWTPSYAGGSKRADFLLKKEKIIIEVKKTRSSLKEKELGEQLIIDIECYKKHPDCEKIICFVYDPDYILKNPYAIENDLNEKSSDLLKVNTYIFPK